MDKDRHYLETLPVNVQGCTRTDDRHCGIPSYGMGSALRGCIFPIFNGETC